MPQAKTSISEKAVDTKALKGILKKYPAIGESLLAILQDVQLEYQFIPEMCLKEISKELALPLNQVYAVATFYNAFSLKPKGKNVIQVCMGTACHVRGATDIVDELERLLNIKCGNTTPDGKFTLETVNCVGACALGPVKVINGDYHGHLTRDKIENILKQYQ